MKTLKWEGVGGLYKGVGKLKLCSMFIRNKLYHCFFS